MITFLIGLALLGLLILACFWPQKDIVIKTPALEARGSYFSFAPVARCYLAGKPCATATGIGFPDEETKRLYRQYSAEAMQEFNLGEQTKEFWDNKIETLKQTLIERNS